MEDIVRIPKERVAVLIGTKGTQRRKLEEQTHCKLLVDSNEGEVIIRGEAVDVYNTVPVVKAIGRGFNPEIATALLKDNMTLKIVDIKDFAKNKNAIARIKSRIIGTDGKCRTTIEDMTDCKLSIYGRTIGIIGEFEMAEVAQEAVENILRGSRHGNVYAWLEQKKKKVFEDRYEQYQS